jgi:hypothetical protein
VREAFSRPQQRRTVPKMAGDRPVLLGLLLYLLVAVTPTVLLWLVVRMGAPTVSAWRERRRRRHPVVSGPPLEEAVANLRRLRREVCRGSPPTQVRRVALQAAYDDTLIEVCRIVGVEAPLEGAPAADREFARLLTEADLEAAGIPLDPPTRR